MKLNVLKQASLPDALTAELARRYHLVELTALTDADFRALAGTFTVLITNGEASVTRELIASLPALELIAVFGVGYDGVDVQAAAEHQVRVSHTPGVLTDDVADLALGLMLATSRQIVAAHKFIEAGEWAAGGFPWTQKVSGSRVGIVGMGRIGQAIARRCEGFAMQIAYHDRKRLPALNYAWREDLLTLAAESDFLVICTPGTAANQGLINQPVLAALGEKGMPKSYQVGTPAVRSSRISRTVRERWLPRWRAGLSPGRGWMSSAMNRRYRPGCCSAVMWSSHRIWPAPPGVPARRWRNWCSITLPAGLRRRRW